ncbi:MAG: DUF1634 domain-containing protein [Chloroflexota bacterium]|nr:DUF1634 domain-containing protein [Chloroflexota bacterium]
MSESGPDELARWVSRTLGVGTALAVGTIALGVLAGLVTGDASVPPGRGLGAQIAAGKPASIVALGLLLLTLTPIAQLLPAVAAFVRQGERRYAAISAILLGLLLIGIAAAAILTRSAGG